MNLNQLYYFKTLAKTQHMTKASELLNISQPSLSYAIKELEKEVGTPLFHKKGRNIEITKYGQLYLKYVDDSLNQLEKGNDLLKELANPNTGHIDLAFIYTLGPYVIPKLLNDFKSVQQNKLITFDLFQSNTQHILKLLKSGTIDIAFCSKIIDDDTIDFRPFFEEEIVLIVPKSHTLANHESIDLKEIKDYPFISFNKDSGLRPTIDSMLNQANITPNIVFEVEEDHTMAGFVSFGHGIALIPKLYALSSYDLTIIPINNPTHQRIIYSAALKEETSPSLERFKDFLNSYQKK